MISFTEQDPYASIHYSYEVENVLFRHKSAFQEIMVISNPRFGKILILDGIVQLTEADEYMYHEMLAHPAMHAHPNPRTIVVIGGGDGGIVREVLKHPTVEKVYLVEIDAEVVEVCRRFFPSVACGLDDPRVEIRPMDGAKFVADADFPTDVVIVDSTDIIGHARSLFTREFFRNVLKCLRDENGIYVSHTESIHFHLQMARQVHQTLKEIFPVLKVYTAPIATYPGNWWCFAIGTRGIDPEKISHWEEKDTVVYCPEMHAKAFLPTRLVAKLFSNTPWPR